MIVNHQAGVIGEKNNPIHCATYDKAIILCHYKNNTVAYQIGRTKGKKRYCSSRRSCMGGSAAKFFISVYITGPRGRFSFALLKDS